MQMKLVLTAAKMNLNQDYLHLMWALHCIQTLTQVTEVVTENIKVFQTPPEIKAFEGDTINMQCSCEQDKTIESIRVDWTKDSMPLIGVTTIASARVNRSYSSINETTAKLTIENIIRNDSGMYLCEMSVEIPAPVRKGQGNGTKLTVQEYHNYRHELAALALLVILGLAILCYKQQRRRKRNAGLSVGDVAEVINEENPENEGHEESSSSRGSSHWLTSSLYESFDYFTIKQEENEETCCNASDS
ncbi:cytotoxic T-lymphocyte protein 4-like [Hypanus sabinus]|uniref:cytotoxic T-lymphocyte protein 4-like n=1 Tax=Hypanus sabinus TaxID=79690 RepID=UPI0028C40728|nr:cytotoxic T-lymphocyte protein 4-like [Hypanus sabinus]